jgi:hypothetical protein
MKLQHAAALALVGWCLAMPPFDYTSPDPPKTPTSEWMVKCPFPNAEACEQRRQKLIEARIKLAKPSRDRMVRVMKGSRCLASDDPLLKSAKVTPDVPSPPKLAPK